MAVSQNAIQQLQLYQQQVIKRLSLNVSISSLTVVNRRVSRIVQSNSMEIKSTKQVVNQMSYHIQSLQTTSQFKMSHSRQTNGKASAVFSAIT